MFWCATSERSMNMHTTHMTLIFKFMQILALFLFGFTVSPFMVVWWVAFLKDYLFSFSIYFFHIYTLWFFLVFWTNVPFTSRNGLEPVGWDWWFFIKSLLFCLVIKKHEISFEYLLKLRSLYCCCGTIFEAWKVKNVFSNIWFTTQFELWGNFKRSWIIFTNRFKILQPQVQPIITSFRKYDKFLVVISFL